MKALADNKLKCAHMMKFLFNRLENILGKGESAGCQHFLLFPKCFRKATSTTVLRIFHMYFILL